MDRIRSRTGAGLYRFFIGAGRRQSGIWSRIRSEPDSGNDSQNTISNNKSSYVHFVVYCFYCLPKIKIRIPAKQTIWNRYKFKAEVLESDIERRKV